MHLKIGDIFAKNPLNFFVLQKLIKCACEVSCQINYQLNTSLFIPVIELKIRLWLWHQYFDETFSNFYIFHSRAKFSCFHFFILSGIGTSDFCLSETYRGPVAFSEIEVKNVATFLKTLNLKAYWNVHAYGQLILYPWSYTKNVTRDQTEMVRFFFLSERVTDDDPIVPIYHHLIYHHLILFLATCGRNILKGSRCSLWHTIPSWAAS